MDNENKDAQSEKLTLDVTQFPTLEALEREYISLAMKKANGSKAKAAQMLGVSIKTIYNKLHSYSNTTAE